MPTMRDTARAVFHDTRAPTTLEIAKLALDIQKKVLARLRARGFSFDDSDRDLDSTADETALITVCYSASVQGKIALGAEQDLPIATLSAPSQSSESARGR